MNVQKGHYPSEEEERLPAVKTSKTKLPTKQYFYNEDYFRKVRSLLRLLSKSKN